MEYPCYVLFLNQEHADLRLVLTLFLKIVSVWMSVCMRVCVSAPRLLITIDVIWTPYD